MSHKRSIISYIFSYSTDSAFMVFGSSTRTRLTTNVASSLAYRYILVLFVGSSMLLIHRYNALTNLYRPQRFRLCVVEFGVEYRGRNLVLHNEQFLK
jgi:hypothetical protein